MIMTWEMGACTLLCNQHAFSTIYQKLHLSPYINIRVFNIIDVFENAT